MSRKRQRSSSEESEIDVPEEFRFGWDLICGQNLDLTLDDLQSELGPDYLRKLVQNLGKKDPELQQQLGKDLLRATAHLIERDDDHF